MSLNHPDTCPCSHCYHDAVADLAFERGVDWGARWLAAIITMAEAIRENYPLKHQWDPRGCWCGGSHKQPSYTY